MSNQPPYPGSPDQGPEEEPTRQSGGGPEQGSPDSGNPGTPQQGTPHGAPPQPNNPYGQPQQGNPYGASPQQNNPYGAPPQQNNPYGAPPQQNNPYGAPPQQNNPYGGPQQYNPYGQGPPPNQPVWQGHQAPQQGYGPGQQQWQQGAYGPGQGGQPKSRKKWLIPVIAIVAVLLVLGGIVAAISLGGDSSSGTAVDDLSEGDCLVSSDIADASDSIGDIETVDCGDDHDAEVFATYDVGADDAGSDFDLDAAGSTCVDKLSDAGTTLDDLEADGNEVRPLVGSDEPSEGDQVVCFIRNSDGDQLSDSVIG